MNLTIQRNCEQCGGAMEIHETDTLLECPWCGVRHFLDIGNARYVLPHKDIKGQLIHVPYLRLKGSLFSCNLDKIEHRVVDTTVGATGINVLPKTLGLRPQTLKLQFATDSINTTYLNHSMSWNEAINSAASVQHLTEKGSLHTDWLGETFSTIYQPLIIQDNIVLDGVTLDKLAKLPGGKDPFKSLRMDNLGWHTTLLPTLCPQCGWDMQSDQASVIYLCSNCDSAWRNKKGHFRPVTFATVVSKHTDPIYLPFWKMEVEFSGLKLSNLAEFIRITNIPRMIKSGWENEPVSFFSPAFKIRPKIFLRLAGQLTSAQRPMEAIDTVPNGSSPVSLTAKDAEESIKLILAQSAVAKRNIMPILPEIKIERVQTKLLFLPFFDNGYELCQEELQIVINKQILEWGTKL